MNRVLREKKGFTLVELAIVMVIIGLIMGAGVTIWKSTIDSTRLSTTKTNLDHIKNAVIHFAIANGRLPCPDSTTPPNNTGQSNPACAGCANPPCYVPYQTLQINLPGGRDSFGNVFRYDICYDTAGGLSNTTQDTFCGVLFEYMSHAADTGAQSVLPCVTNQNDAADNGQIGAAGQGYGVAAVIISQSPVGNVFDAPPGLGGKNLASSPREYEMANRANGPAYGDLVAELTYGDLYNKVCTAQKTKIRIQNNTGAQKYAKFDGSNTCVPIPAASFVDLYQGSTITFYNNASCTPSPYPCGSPITFNMTGGNDAGHMDWIGAVTRRDGRVQINGACSLSDY